MDTEKYFDSKKIKGRVQQVIAEKTAEALCFFADQAPAFAMVLEQEAAKGKTYQSCLDAITKDISASKPGISDFEIYDRAAKYYLPDARISYTMSINLSDDTKPCITMTENKPDTLNIKLDDLLNF